MVATHQKAEIKGVVHIKPTSKKTFLISGKSAPNKTEKKKGWILANLNVRTWAGKEKPTTSFSPVDKGKVVTICDAILADDNSPWYYIKVSGKYGFVSAKYVKVLSKKLQKFIDTLNAIHDFVRIHPANFYYHYDSSLTTFEQVKKRVAENKMVGFTCVVPMRLAFKEAGVERSDGKSLLVGYHGTFATTFTGKFKELMTRITKGGAIGLTVKKAVDKDLLQIGDTIAYEDATHTFTYTGRDYLMYDGGHKAIKSGLYTGIIADYKNDKRKISEIIRWKS